MRGSKGGLAGVTKRDAAAATTRRAATATARWDDENEDERATRQGKRSVQGEGKEAAVVKQMCGWSRVE